MSRTQNSSLHESSLSALRQVVGSHALRGGDDSDGRTAARLTLVEMHERVRQQRLTSWSRGSLVTGDCQVDAVEEHEVERPMHQRLDAVLEQIDVDSSEDDSFAEELDGDAAELGPHHGSVSVEVDVKSKRSSRSKELKAKSGFNARDFAVARAAHLLTLSAELVRLKKYWIVIQDEELCARLLSIIPDQCDRPDDRWIDELFHWFQSHFEVASLNPQFPHAWASDCGRGQSCLLQQMHNAIDFVRAPSDILEALFVSCAVALQKTARIVYVAHPLQTAPTVNVERFKHANLVAAAVKVPSHRCGCYLQAGNERRTFLAASRARKRSGSKRSRVSKAKKICAKKSKLSSDDNRKNPRRRARIVESDVEEISDPDDQSVNLSSGEDESQLNDELNTATLEKHRMFVEVFADESKRWIPLDVTLADGLDCLHLLQKQELGDKRFYAFSLMLAIGFPAGLITDVTRRYVRKWSKVYGARTVETSDFLESELNDCRGQVSHHKHCLEIDEEEMSTIASKEPLPKSVGAFRRHPLYCVEKYLTKFEAIEPGAKVIGYCGKNDEHAIYPLSKKHLLHTEDKWLQLEARVVKQCEKPFKIVKSSAWRAKKHPTTALYGRWQTESYIPPVAQDGQVPVNPKYGRVDLWLPQLLPGGTVHLNYPRIRNVARKLGIHCPEAMVGFDIKKSRFVPVEAGIVVCKEYESAVMEAYRKSEKERAAKAEESRMNRIIQLWSGVVRGTISRLRIMGPESFPSKRPSSVVVSAEKLCKRDAIEQKINAFPEHSFPARAVLDEGEL